VLARRKHQPRLARPANARTEHFTTIVQRRNRFLCDGVEVERCLLIP